MLIHTLALITVTAILLSVSTSVLFSLFRTARNVRSQALYATTVGRLSRQLRDDAHAASAVHLLPTETAADTPRRLVLQFPGDQRILYQLATDRIVRTMERPTQTPRRETYPIPADSTPGWEIEQHEGLTTVSLLLPRAADLAATKRGDAHAMRITAAVGFDLRFSVDRDTGPEP
jgi:hypothetical protein